jgi:hypothetical protein
MRQELQRRGRPCQVLLRILFQGIL